MASRVAVVGRLCMVNSCRVSHFGIKPVSGGSPPKDISKIKRKVEVGGEIVQEVVRSLIFFAVVSIRVIKVVVVIKRYRNRLRSMMFGFSVRIAAIQPRWAIDENAMIFRVCV